MRVLSFFSFYGRTRRTVFGVFSLAAIPVFLILVTVAVIAAFQTFGREIVGDDPDGLDMLRAAEMLPHQPFVWASAIVGVLWIAMCIAWIALCVRRLHDMGGTGWIVVPLLLVAILWFFAGYLLISLVLSIWPGSKGANRHGRDPRSLDDIAAVFADPTRPTKFPT